MKIRFYDDIYDVYCYEERCEGITSLNAGDYHFSKKNKYRLYLIDKKGKLHKKTYLPSESKKLKLLDKGFKKITLKDLNNKMVVELRNGSRFMVYNDILMGEDKWTKLDRYNEDLTFKQRTDKQYDIMAIYLLGANTFNEVKNTRKVIWHRPDKIDWFKLPKFTKLIRVEDAIGSVYGEITETVYFLSCKNGAYGFEIIYTDKSPFDFDETVDKGKSTIHQHPLIMKVHPDQELSEEYYRY